MLHVSFYATLRQVVGGKTVTLDLPPGASVQTLLDALVERFPGLREKVYSPAGERYTYIHIFVNGRDAQLLPQGYATVLSPADTINIFPPVGGGQGPTRSP
jgi:MoaD family protein